jgi:hypothetical protein
VLANNSFRVALGGTVGESNVITVAVEWEDPAEGVEIVGELLKIWRERQRQDRMNRLKDSYNNQREIVGQKNQEVEKAQKALNQYLNEQGFVDAATLKSDLEYYTGRVQELEGLLLSNTRGLEIIRGRIETIKERIARQKEAKGPPAAAGADIINEHRDELDARINEQHRGLGAAKAALARKEREYQRAQFLSKEDVGAPKAVEDAALRHKYAKEDAKNIEQLIGRLEGQKAQLNRGMNILQVLLWDQATLELDRDAAQRALERSKDELLEALRRVSRLGDVNRGANQLQEAEVAREKDREEQDHVLWEIGLLRDNDAYELQVVDAPKAQRISVGQWIPFAAFAACLALLLPGILTYDRLRSRPGRRPPGPGA